MAIPDIRQYEIPGNSTLIKNKTDWQINPHNAVLLIHDMQQYFVNIYPQNSSPIVPVIEHIQKLKYTAKNNDIPVIYTAQPANQTIKNRALLTDFWGAGPGEENIAIIDALSPDDDDIQYTKWRYSAFKRTPLLDYMRDNNKDQLIICGIYGHIGILSTALDAFMYDIKPFVIGNAIADFTAEDHQYTLNYIANRCGHVKPLKKAIKEISENGALPVNQPALSLESMQKDIADILLIAQNDVEMDENLTYLGLDSIRAMTLMEKWRSQGIQLKFSALAQTVTLRQWWEIFQENLNKQLPAEDAIG